MTNDKSMKKKRTCSASKILYCLLCTSFGLIGLLWYTYTVRINEHVQNQSGYSPTIDKKENMYTPDIELESENTKTDEIYNSNIPQSISYSIKKLENTAAITVTQTESKFMPSEMHFVHIPKCGGTSMTAVLREVACHLDPAKNEDCCTNPGFCDWHAKRRCKMIKGCINHFPQRKYIFQSMPSITILREPVSRLLSAWFYRGHSPNIDFFQVRPEFKEIKEGKRPK
eukprot:gene3839-7645_t